MKKTEIQMAVLEGLGEMLGEHGFKLKRTDKCLVRKISEGTQKISVSMLDYNPTFMVEIYLFVYLDAVEELVGASEGRTFPRGWPSLNIGSQYFYPEEPQNGSKKFPVRIAEDIENLLKELRPLVTGQFLEFFAEYDNVIAVENLLNWVPGRFKGASYPTRGQVGVTTAFVGNPERFEEIAKRYEEEMEAWKVPRPEPVAATIAYLRDLRSKAGAG